MGETGRSSVIRFHVSEYYDERELESLLEILEARGAEYHQLQYSKNWFKLLVPEKLDLDPYCRTLEDCESIDHVVLGLSVLTVSTKPEG